MVTLFIKYVLCKIFCHFNILLVLPQSFLYALWCGTEEQTQFYLAALLQHMAQTEWIIPAQDVKIQGCILLLYLKQRLISNFSSIEGDSM
jgi:hypothetical protein